ncbi:MAG: hypothetical protein OXU23_22085 [Candidatus Poribacteria bacterium]|nr:hypothetical protein [Candidatus Poribacteria bacterium]
MDSRLTAVSSRFGDRSYRIEVWQGTKLVAITEKRDRPISVLILSASCHEVGLVEPALDACWTSATPAVLIGAKSV